MPLPQVEAMADTIRREDFPVAEWGVRISGGKDHVRIRKSGKAGIAGFEPGTCA
jgi:hypothetical protein